LCLFCSWFWGAPALAQNAKIDIFSESTRAANLCFDLVVRGKDRLDSLIADGYAVKHKKRSTQYSLGTKVIAFGAKGVSVAKWGQDRNCSFSVRGIGNSNGNKIYASFQDRLRSSGFSQAGYNRGTSIYSKGNIRLGLRGSSEGSAISIKLFHYER
jgi:hypothetical protein